MHCDAILEMLAFAIRRDEAKGGDGWRSTVDVAERLGVKTVVARRELDRLYRAGLVDWDGPIEGLGTVHFWRLAELDDGEREPVPANDNEALTRRAA